MNRIFTAAACYDTFVQYKGTCLQSVSRVRHRLIHDYGGTNRNIIADIVFGDLPILTEQLKKIIGI